MDVSVSTQYAAAFNHRAVVWCGFVFGIDRLSTCPRRWPQKYVGKAPLVLRVLGAVGSAALAIGGILVEGFHIAAVGPLFAVGGLAFLWLIWTGVKIVVTAEPELQRAPQLTAA